MARLAKIQKTNPAAAERSDVQEVAADIDKYAALAGLASTPVGETLMKALSSDVAGGINALIQGYKSLPHVELQALCAGLDAKVQLLRTLKRSPTNLDLAEDYLEELIR